MANYAAALANDGIVWKPRLVTEIRDRSGAAVKKFDKTQAAHADATNTELSLIRDAMHAVTSDRDGTVAFVFQNYPVSTAGKSGTAESPAAGKVDAWFIGFASFDAPSIAFVAVLDEFTEVPGRFGSVDSAMAVRSVLDAAFK
jgi:penicillin-binding protein 2